MNEQQLSPKAITAKKELEALLHTLQHNREKVPLEVLKTTYKGGYQTLCQKIKTAANDYLFQIIFSEMRIHKDYIEEGVPLINDAIKCSGIPKQLSVAAFEHQDILEFTNLALNLKSVVFAALTPFWKKHIVQLYTADCLNNPDLAPVPYCLANNYVLLNGKWLAYEDCSSELFTEHTKPALPKSA